MPVSLSRIIHHSQELYCRRNVLSIIFCPYVLIMISKEVFSCGVGGIVVSIAAFQAVDPRSIPGRRNILFLLCLFKKHRGRQFRSFLIFSRFRCLPEEITRTKRCVGRESNPGQLLGRQLCSPLYHRRHTKILISISLLGHRDRKLYLEQFLDNIYPFHVRFLTENVYQWVSWPGDENRSDFSFI